MTSRRRRPVGRPAGEGFSSVHKLATAIVAMAMVVAIGTVGFVSLENMTTLDALYMTVITLSTVGFGEIMPLHPSGRIFAMFLIFIGVALVMYTATSLGQLIVEGQLRKVLGRKKMEKQMKKLSNHYIIAGYGRVGHEVAREFERRGVRYIVVENEPETLRGLDHAETMHLEGDATDEDVLRAAGIGQANTLISTLPDEAHNVYLTLTARDLNQKLKIIARADYDGGEKKLMRAGADHVVSPHVLGGMRMALASLQPNVLDFMHTTAIGETGLIIEELVLPPKTRFAGLTLAESGLRDDYGVHVIGIKKQGEPMHIAPGPRFTLDETDTLVLIGPTADLERLSGDLSG